ncbi:hypothetical protein FLO80_20010 [Aquicoccus porphyridii]|uniref:Uncharacterized protein n=1 Tax=Aquicoccus porphyridii TaxID=1852029 RepID=A0A5A9YXP8_9RHOB|nr:hypothetical protein [Aquicoccus porphyridii]KAA0909773.1 hypothetical protein FLO80_20010 [Aquicoccus porphyridii]RAI52870.1 hypothetical protein DOO74_15390 [Rhodobacteraceae bacterium AsT-22]
MRLCLETATEQFQECAEYEDQGYEACDRWEDQGYEACDDWDDRCCDWWPCSWGCKLISWVCVGWVWVSNMVCVAWVWVSNLVCVAWTVITTTVCLVWALVEIILLPIAWLVELVQSIPVIGRIIDMLGNLIVTIVKRIIDLPTAVLDLIGIRPLKRMELCVIILRDEEGNPVSDQPTLQPFLDETVATFRREANVHVHVSGIHTVAAPSPTYALDVNCDGAAVLEDLWLTGSYFQRAALFNCSLGSTSRIGPVRPQIVVFAVRDIPGTTAGCALGPLTDYLTVEGRNPVCIPHEVGHKVGLWHCCDGTNLANPTCGGIRLRSWQVAIARNSKYISWI